MHHQSSGDLIADRRFAYGRDCAADGDHAAAIDLFEQAIERAPEFAPAWFELGKARLAAGKDDAGRAFTTALHLEPEDRLGAGLYLTQISGVTDVARPAMNAAFVRGLFDQYAPRFDAHLVGALGYVGPEALFALLEKACARADRPMQFRSMIDLGCGTGLAGERFSSVCETMLGCDLSPAMIARAAAKQLYSLLETVDAVAFLTAQREPAEFILAADMLPYMGELAPLFVAVAARMERDGVFAFSAQWLADGDGFTLGVDMRFAHSVPYIEGVAAEAGLKIVALEHGTIRQDRGEGIPSLLVLLAPQGSTVW